MMDSSNSFGSLSSGSPSSLAYNDAPPRPNLKSKKTSLTSLSSINTPGGVDTTGESGIPGDLSGNPDLEAVMLLGQAEGILRAMSGLLPGFGVIAEEFIVTARQVVPQLIAAKQAGSPLGLAAGTPPGMQAPGSAPAPGMGSSAQLGPGGVAGQAMPPGGVGGGPQQGF